MTERTDKQWSLYMLRCADGSLYTGVSTDVERRVREHSGLAGHGRGAKALRGKGPLRIEMQFLLPNKSEALKLEYKVKQLTRTQKEELVQRGSDLQSLRSFLAVNE